MIHAASFCSSGMAVAAFLSFGRRDVDSDLIVEQAQRVDAEKRLAAELARGWLRRRPG